MLLAHLSEPPPPLAALRPGLPAAAGQVMARAMAKGPEQRYASCREFTDALREAFGLPPYHSGGIARRRARPAAGPVTTADPHRTPGPTGPAAAGQGALARASPGRVAAAGPAPVAPSPGGRAGGRGPRSRRGHPLAARLQSRHPSRQDHGQDASHDADQAVRHLPRSRRLRWRRIGGVQAGHRHPGRQHGRQRRLPAGHHDQDASPVSTPTAVALWRSGRVVPPWPSARASARAATSTCGIPRASPPSSSPPSPPPPL